MVNLARRQPDQAAAKLVRQPTDSDRNASRGGLLATPGRPRLGPGVLEPDQIAGRRTADRGDGPRADQVAPDPRLVGSFVGGFVGGRRRQPEGARRSRCPPGRLGRRQRSGRNRDHAYARASASAVFRKLRMYCAMENSDTAVET